MKKQKHLKDNWNRLDFMIIFTQIAFYLVSSFVSFDNRTGPKLLNMMRLARLLRVLQLVKTLPQLRLIVHALLEAANAMQYIFVILMPGSACTGCTFKRPSALIQNNKESLCNSIVYLTTAIFRASVLT